MDEKQTQIDEITAGIHERMAALDAPVRDLILSNEYIANLQSIMSAHSLTKESAIITEEITTSFLLGTIRPNDLEQVFIEDLSSMSKENIRSLYNDIKSKILYQVWDIIDAAWKDDDEKEEIFKEVIEVSEVPLPPNFQQNCISTVGEKIQKEINQKIIESRPEPQKSNKINIEEKLIQKEIKQTQRETIDRTIPPISIGQGDLYREKPE